MMGSLYSGVSGLNAHQQCMDVVANDIANVNTVGYQQSEVTFEEALVETLIAPAAGTPGVSEGTGVQIGAIVRDFSGGALTETGISSNLAIQGQGFFVVQDTDAAGAAVGPQYYTRAGSFNLDVRDENTVHLITPNGSAVLGIDGTPINLKNGMPAGVDLVSFSVAQDGTITSIGSDGLSYEAGTIAVVMFQNNNGLVPMGSNLYTWTAAASTVQPALDGTANPQTMNMLQGYLEYSNVDLAREFTNMIVAQRGFQANSRAITTSDEMLQELLRLK